MSVLLKEAIGTAYIIDTISKLLRSTLDDLAKSTEEVDLSGTRFGPHCASILEEYYGKITFGNTEDPELNELLKYNNNVIKDPPEEWNPLYIENICTEDYLTKIKEIPAGKYKVELRREDRLHSVIVVLILLSRPDIDLDLTECSSLISELMNEHINIQDFDDEDQCYVFDPPNVTLVDKSKVKFDKKIKIPACVGSKKIVDLDTGKVDKRFRNLLIAISDRIDDVFYPKDRSEQEEKEFINIYDYIELKEE